MKPHPLSIGPVAIIIVAGTLLTACGDLLASSGEEGLVSYRLFTDYELESSELTDTSIVTGHTQHFYTDLTAQGLVEIVDQSRIDHQVSPAEGATITTSLTDHDADFSLTVAAAGEYVIQSTVDGEVVDQITLHFAEPEGIELVTRVREPYGLDFFQVSEAMPTTTPEGSQVSFFAIPLDGFGMRLAGDISTHIFHV